jgi:hypothetical protein
MLDALRHDSFAVAKAAALEIAEPPRRRNESSIDIRPI